MNRTSLMTLALAGTMVLAAGAPALAQDRVLASVPFDFNVGSAWLPAGDYEVSRLTANTSLVWNTSTHDSAVTITTTASTEQVSEPAALVFHQYGTRYFLSEIRAPESRKKLYASKLERQVSAQERESAENKSGDRNVVIAAR